MDGSSEQANGTSPLSMSLTDILASNMANDDYGVKPIMPDVIQVTEYGNYNSPVSSIDAIADDCNNLLADITKRLNRATAECAKECQEIGDKCCACLVARSEITVDYVKKVLDKCQGKILKQISSDYSDTVGRLMQLGCTYPTTEELQYFFTGKSRGGTGGIAVNCAPGEEGTIDPETGLPICKPIITNVCQPPNELVWNPDTQSYDCKPPPPPPPPPPKSCPPGTYPSGQTNSDGSPICLPFPICPPGTNYDVTTGKCLPPPPPPPPKCPDGSDPPCPPPPPKCPDGSDPPCPPPPPPPPPGGGGPGCPPNSCTAPAGTYFKDDGSGTQVAYYDVPVVTSKGCTYACIAIPFTCNCANIKKVPPKAGPAPRGGPTDLGLGDIIGNRFGSYGSCNGGKYICKIVCDDITKCPPPHVCPDGWVYDEATGVCTQIKTDAGNCDLSQADHIKYVNWELRNCVPYFSYVLFDAKGNEMVDAQGQFCYHWFSISELPGVIPQPSQDQIDQAVTASKLPPDCGPKGPPDNGGSTIDESGPCTPAATVKEYDLALHPTATVPQTTALDSPFKFDCSKWVTGTGWICQIANGAIEIFTSALSRQLKLARCITPQFVNTISLNAVAKFIGKFTGGIPQSMLTAIEYQENLQCQYKVPNTGEMNRLRVTGRLKDDEWKAGVAINGDCIPWQELVKDSDFRYPSINEAVTLYRRGFVDQDTYRDYATKNGVKDQQTADWYEQIQLYVPGPMESAGWSQRQMDVDETAVNLSLDDGFDSWWDATGERLSRASGVEKEIVRKQYRSSWQLPSLPFAIEAYNRIKESTKVPGTDRTAEPVTSSELNSLIDSQRMPDGWGDRAALLSYTPITIRHLRMLLASGVIDERELSQRYQNLGYTPDDSDLLAHANVIASRAATASLKGLPSQKEVVALYSEDAISRGDAESSLNDIGLDADPVKQILDVADTFRDARQRRTTIRTVKQRFMFGDFSSEDARQELLKAGVVAEKTDRILGDWSTALRLKKKEATIGMLCEWRDRGYITDQSYVERLLRLGFTFEDAQRIQMACGDKKDEKDQEKLKKAIEKAAREAKAAAKAARPCNPRPKPYCTPKLTVRYDVVHDSTLAKGEKSTETDITQIEEQQGDATIFHKTSEKHLTT